MRSFRVMRRVALAVWAFGALFVYPAAHANAGLLTIPVPTVSVPSLPLPTVSPLPLPSLPIVNSLIPTPTVTGVPPVPLPGQLNDTVNEVTGLLGGGSNGPNQPGTNPGNGGSTTGSTSHPSGHTTTSGPTKGATNKTHVGSGASTLLDGIGVIQPGEAFEGTYGSMAGRAAEKAAGRALNLAGPLAPPLLLSMMALAVLMMLSKGSTKLVKLDVAGLARRTWRI